MIDAGEYFTINRARQYGKTTLLAALAEYLKSEYKVISLDFQTISYGDFENEEKFVAAFSNEVLISEYDIPEIAELIFSYTSGYPYLVSCLCKMIDEDIKGESKTAWSKQDVLTAVKMLLNYIEARTRNDEQTDMIIDYLGQQYIIEMKIWHGNAYNERGEKQLSDYLEYYHADKGYMLSFNFNKNKKIGVKEVVLGEKLLIEAVV